MRRKNILCLLVVVALFAITGCVMKSKNNTNESVNSTIEITDKDKGYVTTFKTVNNKFVQTNSKYNHVDSEELGVFITFQYIESTKEAYDYAKTHNFLGVEYSKDQIKEYKWNNYEGYFYSVSETEIYFRILLVDDKDNSIVLSGFVGPKVSSENKNEDLTKFTDNEDFQKFLNSIEFKKEEK